MSDEIVGVDGTPAWAYDEDGYCVCCGNGRWKHHMPECELRDALEVLRAASGPLPPPPPDAIKRDIEIASRAMRSQSWPGEMAEEMEQRAKRIDRWLASGPLPERGPTEHDAWTDPIDGGYSGYEAKCHDCNWRGGKHDPHNKAAAQADARRHRAESKVERGDVAEHGAEGRRDE